MPAIPMYQQRTEAAGQFNPGGADPSAFGAGVGQALGNVAGGLQSVEQAGEIQRRSDAHVLRTQEERDAQSRAGVTASTAQLEWAKNLQDRKANALPGAPDFTPGLLSDFDAYAKTTVENEPSLLAKHFVQQHLTSLRTSLGQHAIAFEGGARVALRNDNALVTIDNSAKLVQQDPFQYSAQMALIRQTLPAVGPEHEQKLNEHAVKTLTNAAASTIMDANPYAVKDATGKAMGDNGYSGKTGVAWIDDATAEQVKQWNSQAQVKITQIENAKARDAAGREADALRTVNGAVELADKGQYFTPEFTAQLKASAAGTPYAAQAQALIDNQAQTAGFAAAPAADRTAALEMARAAAVTPGKGVDPSSSKDLTRWERIDSAIKAAYKDNPWQAAQQYGAIQRAPVANITQPGDLMTVIANRAPFAAAVEAHAGQTISLLQPQEAEQFGRLLRKLPPDQEGAVLSQAGIALGSPARIAALAKQLGAGDQVHELMLLSAGDKTNAGRTTAELIRRGAQALTDKTVKPEEAPVTGWKSVIAGLVDNTLGNPEAEDQIKRSAYFVRAAMENNGAKAPGFTGIGNADAESSVAMVVGWPIERQGVKTLLPKGMKEGDFDVALSKYTAPALTAMAPDGKLYLGGKEFSAQTLASQLSDMALRRWDGSTYIPLRNGRPITVDPAGTVPLKLKVQ